MASIIIDFLYISMLWLRIWYVNQNVQRNWKETKKEKAIKEKLTTDLLKDYWKQHF